MRMVFDTFMRMYSKIFVILVLLTFVINEFIPKDTTRAIIQAWLITNFTLVIVSYILQSRLRKFVEGDIKRALSLAFINNVDRPPDIVDMILNMDNYIPGDFDTYNQNANHFLEASHLLPSLYDVAWTAFDRKFLRFSWLRVKKQKPDVFIPKLKFGDFILYHRCGSIIGSIIRFFTRCFWEHTAIYVGDGKVIEAVPGGGQKSNIERWLLNDKISLGVLRPRKKLVQKMYDSTIKEVIGRGYNYIGVLGVWWRIITGSSGLGFMTPLIIFLNLIQFSLAVYLTISLPEYTRFHIFLVLLTGTYMFATIYHKIAYDKDFESILSSISEVLYEKS